MTLGQVLVEKIVRQADWKNEADPTGRGKQRACCLHSFPWWVQG